MKMLVTGFGPFLGVDENPSAILATKCGLPHRVIEVSFRAVDEDLGEIDPLTFDGLLLIGVAQRASKMRIELVARNAVGSTPDVRTEIHGPMPVDVKLSGSLSGTLWRSPEFYAETEAWQPSVDAGDYLCNFVYHRALSVFPDKLVGFLHVPPVTAMSIERQQDALMRILDLVSEDASLGAVQAAP